jgi:hypothetical protein
LSDSKFASCQKRITLPKLMIGNHFVNTCLQYQITQNKDCFNVVISKDRIDMMVTVYVIELNDPIVFSSEQKMLIKHPLVLVASIL